MDRRTFLKYTAGAGLVALVGDAIPEPKELMTNTGVRGWESGTGWKPVNQPTTSVFIDDKLISEAKYNYDTQTVVMPFKPLTQLINSNVKIYIGYAGLEQSNHTLLQTLLVRNVSCDFITGEVTISCMEQQRLHELWSVNRRLGMSEKPHYTNMMRKYNL